jgi:hypothetical protein
MNKQIYSPFTANAKLFGGLQKKRILLSHNARPVCASVEHQQIEMLRYARYITHRHFRDYGTVV